MNNFILCCKFRYYETIEYLKKIGVKNLEEIEGYKQKSKTGKFWIGVKGEYKLIPTQL